MQTPLRKQQQIESSHIKNASGPSGVQPRHARMVRPLTPRYATPHFGKVKGKTHTLIATDEQDHVVQFQPRFAIPKRSKNPQETGGLLGRGVRPARLVSPCTHPGVPAALAAGHVRGDKGPPTGGTSTAWGEPENQEGQGPALRTRRVNVGHQTSESGKADLRGRLDRHSRKGSTAGQEAGGWRWAGREAGPEARSGRSHRD